MNLVEAFVTKIIGKPFQQYGGWWQKVEIECYGNISETNVMVDKDDHAKVKMNGVNTKLEIGTELAV